jgi:ATP-dependent helicase/nuclease subunit B
MLPRIVALGSVDEDELEFSDDGQLGGPEASCSRRSWRTSHGG